MPTIAEVREALAGAVKVSGLRCSPYPLTQVNAPCAHVSRAEMDPRMVFGGGSNVYQFRITVFAGGQSDVAQQKELDERCSVDGSESVKVAVEDGDNWSASVDYAAVVRIGGPEDREVGGVFFTVADIDVEVCW